MTCPTCQGNNSSKYCATCRGYGGLCDLCKAPAYTDIPKIGECLCDNCAINQARLVQTMILLVTAAAGIAAIYVSAS